MAKYVMALDQGTTSSRCILFDKQGEIHSVAQKEFEQYYPHPGWVEHNPAEIWSSELSVTTEAMALTGVRPDEIAAIRWIDLKYVNRYDWTRGQLNDIRIAIHDQAWILDIVNTDDYNNWYKLD